MRLKDSAAKFISPCLVKLGTSCRDQLRVVCDLAVKKAAAAAAAAAAATSTAAAKRQGGIEGGGEEGGEGGGSREEHITFLDRLTNNMEDDVIAEVDLEDSVEGGNADQGVPEELENCMLGGGEGSSALMLFLQGEAQ